MNSTLYIVWNDSNNLGIPIIDEQHRGIVTTINSFYYFIREGHGIKALKPTLSILEQYTNIHFQTEEALLQMVEYPDYDNHIKLHRNLQMETKRIAHDSAALKSPELTLSFLKDWWLTHINEKDVIYGPYMKEKLGIISS